MGARLLLRFILSTLVLGGCSYSYITAPHQPYTALLDHAGQVDIAARGGIIATNSMTAAVQAAYAPVDNLEIAASVDFDAIDGDVSRTSHAGGGLAIGTFTRTDVLRAELLVGGNAGYATGSGTTCGTFEPCPMTETFRLSGPYGQAFIQGAIGFEVPYFEFAGGLRLFTNSVSVHAVGSMGTDTTSWYTRGFIDPYVTMRVPIDWFRIELLAGWPVSLAGSVGALPGSLESSMYPYLTLGFGVQVDTMGSPIGTRSAPLTPATE